MIQHDHASALVRKWQGKRVLVVGDLMLDRFIFGSVTRISPEAPVPVVCVQNEKNMPGGAANVALNVTSLGGQASISGMAGNDRTCDELLEVLKRDSIGTTGLVRHDDLITTVKTRVIAERQQVCRVDREDLAKFARTDMHDFIQACVNQISGVDAVILEDYGKGVITQDVIDAVLGAAAEQSIPVAFDPKNNRELRCHGISLATPNLKEARFAAGIEPQTESPDLDKEELRRIGDILLTQWDPEMLLITLGPHGMCLLGRSIDMQVIPTLAREVFDVSGAGDTVIAACVMARLAGASPFEAAALANHAAGVVVGKVGTATCNPDELIHSILHDSGHAV
jgi:D-beta-D-heptose 7-phosphate kinase/D-beta-D-heptose 1-phosphate adenosyltransferase